MNRILYLILVWGDVDPQLEGPFENEQDRDNRAAEYRNDEGDDAGGIYRLDLPEQGDPEIYSYGGGEMNRLLQKYGVSLP